jgi:hypothetical protein
MKSIIALVELIQNGLNEGGNADVNEDGGGDELACIGLAPYLKLYS